MREIDMERNRNTSDAQFGSVKPTSMHDTDDRRARRITHDGPFWKVQDGATSFSAYNEDAAKRRMRELDARDKAMRDRLHR